jgi:uncharacterized paraquat-inducible protein A
MKTWQLDQFNVGWLWQFKIYCHVCITLFLVLFLICMQLEHKVTRKTGYITNSIYIRGIRDEHRLDQGVWCLTRGEEILRWESFLCRMIRFKYYILCLHIELLRRIIRSDTEIDSRILSLFILRKAWIIDVYLIIKFRLK